MIDLTKKGNKKPSEKGGAGSGVEKWYLEFYAASFGTIDRVDDVLKKGCFAKTLKENAELEIEIPLVYGHDYNRPITTIVKYKEDDYGLLGRAILPYAGDAKKAVSDLNNKQNKTFSFGFDYVDIDFIWDSEKSIHFFMVNEVKLYETSTAAVPCNPGAKLVKIEKYNPEVHDALMAD